MKFPTVLAFAVFTFTALACGGAGVGAGGASLTAPWTDMNLPMDGATVMYSDSSTVSIQYKGERVSEIAGEYKGAFESGGWSQTVDIENDGNHVINYEKDGKTAAFGITSQGGNTIAGGTLR